MITKKLIRTIDELQAIQRLATNCEADVAFHSLDSSIIIDAKSYIGMYALNFKEPILVVCEDAQLHQDIATIGETVTQ
ncbi:MAG: hypothetical protein K0S04_1246 [Herbinix sp.]|jgi:hypothetical protein|nr:hypothetical protein [Herbinix sp.]